jgi:hypothetical protein
MERFAVSLRSAGFVSGALAVFLVAALPLSARADSVCDANGDGMCDTRPGVGGACVRDGKPGICVQRSGCNCEAALPVEGGVLPGFSATCEISGKNENASVFMRACNDTGATLYGVTPTRLTISTTGTADVEFTVVPGWRRELVDGNCVTFKTQLSLSGCGAVDVHGDVTAEDPDGVTFTTGVAVCGSLLSNPIECLNLTPTPTRTPKSNPTLRPTRTPLFTATPRPPLPTPTRKPTKEYPTLRPTRTPLTFPTRLPTPTLRPQKENPTLRPTRTPLFTATPRPPLPTPTRKPTKEYPTLRPTRTPMPTATPGPFLAEDFTGRCIALNPRASEVTVYLQLFNDTGGPVYDIVPGDIEIQTYGNVTIESVTGPVPHMIRMLSNAHSNRFQWTIQATGEGQIVTHVSATGVGGVEQQGVVVSTGRQECNVLNIPGR